MTEVLAGLDRAVAAILRSFVILALATILILIALGIVARTVPVFSMSGYDEIIELLIVWITFIGMVALWRESALFRIDLSVFVKSQTAVRVLDGTAKVLMLIFAVVFTVKGWQFTAGSIETMPFLFVSKQLWYAAMPVCGFLAVIYAMAALVRLVVSPKSAAPH